jgi:hypothetical protein
MLRYRYLYKKKLGLVLSLACLCRIRAEHIFESGINLRNRGPKEIEIAETTIVTLE